MQAIQDESTVASENSPRRSRLRFELVFASVCLAFGCFVLPGVIYAVGVMLLGPYGQNTGMAAFYGDFFSDLAAPSGRTWLLALGPAILAYLVRLLFIGVRAPEPPKAEDVAVRDAPRSARDEHARVEPRVTLD